MPRIMGVVIPADGKSHAKLPRNAIGALGATAPVQEERAVVLWVLCQGDPKKGEEQAPVQVFEAPCDIPEGAMFLGHVPPHVFVYQVPPAEGKPRIVVASAGSIPTNGRTH